MRRIGSALAVVAVLSLVTLRPGRAGSECRCNHRAGSERVRPAPLQGIRSRRRPGHCKGQAVSVTSTRSSSLGHIRRGDVRPAVGATQPRHAAVGPRSRPPGVLPRSRSLFGSWFRSSRPLGDLRPGQRQLHRHRQRFRALPDHRETRQLGRSRACRQSAGSPVPAQPGIPPPRCSRVRSPWAPTARTPSRSVGHNPRLRQLVANGSPDDAHLGARGIQQLARRGRRPVAHTDRRYNPDRPRPS